MEAKLEVRELSKRYGDFSLEKLSFSLERGTITGFIGENGAGKTTTLSALLGLIKPDSGEIFLDGKKVKSLSGIQAVSYLESNRDLYSSVSMKEYKRFISRVYKKDWSEEKYQYYMKKFGVETSKRIKDLSTGMRLKFYLAIELSKQPDLILLDEPTSGLDPLARLELLKILRAMVEREKTTILFSSHITSDIERISDKVIFLHQGRILLDLNEKEIEEQYRAIDKSKLENLDQKSRQLMMDQGYHSGNRLIFQRDIVRDNEDITQSASLDEVFALLTGGKEID